MWRAVVGSGRLGSGCLVLRANTRENPGGKNSVMTASGNTRLWRRTGRPRRPSATTNDDSRSRRRPGRTRNKTSSLGIKLRLQVPGDGSISTSTNVLHGVVLVICIRRALRSINHSLALRKAIGPAMAPTATTSVRHLQKKTTNNQRVREIRYISFSKKYRKHTVTTQIRNMIRSRTGMLIPSLCLILTRTN
jgi:hypothetical protein